MWSRDGFNRLECLLSLLLVALCAVVVWEAIALEEHEVVPQTGHTLQAFTTLVAWLRILRACYFFPQAGTP